MSNEAILTKMGQLARAIDLCYEQELLEPALILQYSAIDICAWLSNEDSNAKVRDVFVEWANRFMRPQLTLGCTAEELYGARCGLVHTMTGDSKLTQKGKVRHVSYAWGDHKPEVLNQYHQLAGQAGQIVTIHIRELRVVWNKGVVAFLQEVGMDANWAKGVYNRARQFFVDLKFNKEGKLVIGASDGYVPPH